MFWKSSSHYWHGTLSRNRLGTRRARPRFCILYVLGDVLDNGELHFVERAQRLKLQDGVSKRSQRSVQVSTSFTTRKRANGSSLPPDQTFVLLGPNTLRNGLIKWFFATASFE